MRKVLLTIALVLGVLGPLSACGKKGPLYLPEELPAEQRDSDKKPKTPS